MARKTHDDALGVTGAETVIGTGVTIKGNLISESDITIDGNLVGTVKTQGDVTIGVNAEIKGPVEALNITVAGTVHGDLRAEGTATIRETGHVQGDIQASGLAITAGGVFSGRSTMAAPPRLRSSETSDSDEVDESQKNQNR